MIEKFLKKTEFTSHKDFIENYHINVPDNFNFAYDVVDEWAKKDYNKRALCWVDDKGVHKDLSFGEIKDLSDKTASFLQSLGISKGDMVMLILKRSIEFWQADCCTKRYLLVHILAGIHNRNIDASLH
jgi:acetyl-CoA synthetase